MRWRPGHLALLIFQIIWLNVILPGHMRGIVTLPGSGACEESGSSCCSAKKNSNPSKPGQSNGNRAARCAICYFAARVTPPPVVDLRPPALELLAIQSPPARLEAISLERLCPYLGRAPPVI